MNANQRLLLVTLGELQDILCLLRYLRRHCRGCYLEEVLSHHQNKLIALEWEGRHLAIQRGLELREGFPIFSPGRRCRTDDRIARCWTVRNRDALNRYRRVVRGYPLTDPASVFCRKAMDFSATAIFQMEPFLNI